MSLADRERGQNIQESVQDAGALCERLAANSLVVDVAGRRGESVLRICLRESGYRANRD